MHLTNKYLFQARQHQEEWLQEAENPHRTRELRSDHGNKGTPPLGKFLRRTARSLTKLVGRFPY